MNEAAATILIIDDDTASLEFAHRALAAADYAVLTARTGVRGFRRALHVRPDLVLLDIGLPDIDGHEVCRRLKGHKLTAHIPVVFMTARTAIADKQLSFDLLGADYLVKPFARAELVARVRVHLEHSRVRRDHDGTAERLEAQLAEARRLLGAALEHQVAADAGHAQLRALVEVQREQLAAHVQRLVSQDSRAGGGGSPPRIATVDRVRVRVVTEMLQRMQHEVEPDGALHRDLTRAATLLEPLAGAAPLSHDEGHGSADLLSSREREVFDLLILGRTNKEVSAALGVTTSTVSTYRARIMDKLGVETLAGLIRAGLLHGT